MTATPLILLLAAPLFAQDAAMAPAVLPGNGLAQHDFFYAGEQKLHHMFIVKKGQVAWSYIDDASKGEISDAVLLSNGNILFAHQFGVTLIAPDKKVLWNYDAPAGAEVHTAQPIGTKHVLFIQNGDPATLRVVDISTNRTVREFPLPTGNPKSVHGHFRHARLTHPRRCPGLHNRRFPDRHPPAQRQHPRQQLGQRLEHHRRPRQRPCASPGIHSGEKARLGPPLLDQPQPRPGH